MTTKRSQCRLQGAGVKEVRRLEATLNEKRINKVIFMAERCHLSASFTEVLLPLELETLPISSSLNCGHVTWQSTEINYWQGSALVSNGWCKFHFEICVVSKNEVAAILARCVWIVKWLITGCFLTSHQPVVHSVTVKVNVTMDIDIRPLCNIAYHGSTCWSFNRFSHLWWSSMIFSLRTPCSW